MEFENGTADSESCLSNGADTYAQAYMDSRTDSRSRLSKSADRCHSYLILL